MPSKTGAKKSPLSERVEPPPSVPERQASGTEEDEVDVEPGRRPTREGSAEAEDHGIDGGADDSLPAGAVAFSSDDYSKVLQYALQGENEMFILPYSHGLARALFRWDSAAEGSDQFPELTPESALRSLRYMTQWLPIFTRFVVMSTICNRSWTELRKVWKEHRPELPDAPFVGEAGLDDLSPEAVRMCKEELGFEPTQFYQYCSMFTALTAVSHPVYATPKDACEFPFEEQISYAERSPKDKASTPVLNPVGVVYNRMSLDKVVENAKAFGYGQDDEEDRASPSRPNTPTNEVDEPPAPAEVVSVKQSPNKCSALHGTHK
jgi:hypothetical protein